MKKHAILAFACCMLLLCACAAPAAQPDAQATPGAQIDVTQLPETTPGGAISVVLTDMLGRQVEIAGVPAKVVSLSPSATELLFALEAEAALAAVSADCVYPEAVAGIAQVSSVEEVVALQPELVFLDGGASEQTLAALEQAGIPAVCAQAETYADIYAGVALVAQIMGKDASALVEAMQEGVQEVESSAQALSPQTVVCVLELKEDGSLAITGEDSFVTTLIENAGGTPVIFDSPEQASTLFTQAVALEQMLELNPDVLLVSASCMENPAWEGAELMALTAVGDGRVFPIEDDLLTCAGPRVAQAARAIYEALEQAQLS